jgi:hypothetical protein
MQDKEPTYCICSQVSFGEMIACDNEDCSIEWFHYKVFLYLLKIVCWIRWACKRKMVLS